ncbi:MAG: response regulator, partial [Cyanothece sp. SIO1E1]|nr:response regulator [Cyanothece sp. SIO1E1]
MQMPVMDGYEATKQIRDVEPLPATALHHASTKIIALTASVFEETRAEILSLGCDDFVRKPFEEAILFETMAKHLKIEYIYRVEPNPTLANTQKAPAMSAIELAQQMSKMSAEWLLSLQQAVIYLDEAMVAQLIQQIPDTDADLVQQLTTWLKTLRFDEIAGCLEKALALQTANT